MEYSTFNHRQFFGTAEHSAANSPFDMSLHDAAKPVFENKWQQMSPPEKRCTQLLINMTEHYEASSTK